MHHPPHYQTVDTPIMIDIADNYCVGVVYFPRQATPMPFRLSVWVWWTEPNPIQASAMINE